MKIIMNPRRLVGLLVAAALLAGTPAAAQTSLLPTIRQIRAEYPTPMSAAQLGELLTRTAAAGGPEWGVLLKTRGSRCPSAVGEISCDILVHIPTEWEYDILRDAEGDAAPVWQKLPAKCGTPGLSGCDMARVVAVAAGPAPDPLPKPDPPAPPVPGHDPLAELRARVTVLERQMTGVLLDTADIRKTLAAEVGNLQKIIAALPAVELPLYRGNLWGIGITSRPCPECKD